MMNELKENRGRENPTKNGRSQRTRDCENSTGSSVIEKLLTLYSNTQSAFCTDCTISHDEITKMIELYNQSK